MAFCRLVCVLGLLCGQVGLMHICVFVHSVQAELTPVLSFCAQCTALAYTYLVVLCTVHSLGLHLCCVLVHSAQPGVMPV